MTTLEKIDRIKTELQTAKQGLHEADNWTVLANDVEEVYENYNQFLHIFRYSTRVIIVEFNYIISLDKIGIRVWRYRSYS